MKLKRHFMVQLHLVLASFFLVVGIMFLLTGGLYTLDVKGDIDKKIIKVSLDEPFTPNLERLERLTKKILINNQLPLPSGSALLKKKKGKYELRWGDLKYAVKLKQGKTSDEAELVFRERSFLTQLMRIHRAEAGTGFKVLSLVFASGLLLVFFTGIYLAYTIAKYRLPMIVSAGAGVFVFLVFMYI